MTRKIVLAATIIAAAGTVFYYVLSNGLYSPDYQLVSTTVKSHHASHGTLYTQVGFSTWARAPRWRFLPKSHARISVIRIQRFQVDSAFEPSGGPPSEAQIFDQLTINNSTGPPRKFGPLVLHRTQPPWFTDTDIREHVYACARER